MEETQNIETKEKKWIVDTGEGVWEADAETLAQWIMEGAVLPHHKLSREGVRWLEASKVPQFALLFIGQAEVVQAPLPPVDDHKPPVRDEPVSAVPPPAQDEYEVYDSFRPPAPPSFALRLAASSFLALLIAVVISYVWAFHLASKRPISEVEKDPTVVALVEKHESDKVAAQTAAIPVTGPVDLGKIPTNVQYVQRNPKYVQINVPNNLSEREKKAHREAYLRDFNEKDNPEMFEPEFLPPSPASKKAAPTTAPAADPAFAQRMQQLETKFEADKQKAVDAIRSQDAKSKFVSSVGFLFLLLGGLNVGRMKFYDKKDK